MNVDTPVSLGALFTEAKRWEKTQVSMNRGTNQQEVECPYIQCPAVQGSKIPTRATTRMTLEDGMLGETSQAQKDECRVTPLPGSTWNSQIRGWKAGPWWSGAGRVSGQPFSVGRRKGSGGDAGGGCTAISVLTASELCPQKWWWRFIFYITLVIHNTCHDLENNFY